MLTDLALVFFAMSVFVGVLGFVEFLIKRISD